MRHARRSTLRRVAAAAPFGTVRVRGDMTFRVFHDLQVGRLILKRSYERPWAELITRCLDRGDAAIDVGANFGFFTVLMARAVGSSGLVVAIEPNAEMIEMTRSNLYLNGVADRVQLIEAAAVSSLEGRFSVVNTEQSSGLGYAIAAQDGEVAPAMIDDIVTQSRPPALIKIDIEGGEREALEGGGKTLQTAHAPLVVAEFNPEVASVRGIDAKGLLSLLDRHHYSLYVFDRRGSLHRADLAKMQTGNFIAVPPEGPYLSRFQSVLAGAR